MEQDTASSARRPAAAPALPCVRALMWNQLSLAVLRRCRNPAWRGALSGLRGTLRGNTDACPLRARSSPPPWPWTPRPSPWRTDWWAGGGAGARCAEEGRAGGKKCKCGRDKFPSRDDVPRPQTVTGESGCADTLVAGQTVATQAREGRRAEVEGRDAGRTSALPRQRRPFPC